MAFTLSKTWDSDSFRVAICFPTSDLALRPYGVSGVMGAVAGLHDSKADVVAAQVVDTSGGDCEDIVNRVAALNPPPHVCLGVIRSNVAAALVPWCEANNVSFVGTDHSAARFLKGGLTRRYFRNSCVADQLVRTCLHAFSYRYQAARRLLVIVSDYEYGRSIQEATLSLVANHPRWLSVGVVGVIEWPSFTSAADQRSYALNNLSKSLKAVKPDAILLGIWGPSIAAFGEAAVTHMEDLNVPLIMPDAGWDKASHKIPFPQHSVLGARYYVPPVAASDQFLAAVLTSASAAALVDRLPADDLRYPVAAAYDAALAVGRTAAKLAGAGLLQRPFDSVSDFFADSFAQAEVGARANAAMYSNCRFEELPTGERRLKTVDHPVAIAKTRAMIGDHNQWTWFSEAHLLQQFPEAPRRSARSSAGAVPTRVVP